jgi:Uma2 family endonuclease
MNTPATRPASYDDLLDLPDNVIGEIIAGELITHPRPAPRHALAASALGSAIFSRYDRSSPDGPGGWWILDEPECHLGSDIIVPDIAGWRQSTMPELPETAWFEITPDWVCEIISPSTHKHDRSTKRDVYARERIGHYWIVDPVERLIEVFQLVDEHWTLLLTARDDMKASLAPFEAMPFELGRLWA